MPRETWFQKEQLRLLLLVLPFIFLAVFWFDFPERFQLSGNLGQAGEGYVTKYHLLILPIFNILLFALFLGIEYREKVPNYGQAGQVLSHLLLAYLFFVAGLTALGYKPGTELILKYGLICLFLVLGSYLGTLPRNAVIGFRLPWTWESNNIWRKTHRFAAKLWVYLSLLMLIYHSWHDKQEWLFPLYIGLLGLLPIIYSYILYKNDPPNPTGTNNKKDIIQ